MDTTSSTIREFQKDNKKNKYLKKREKSIESEVVVGDDFRSTVTAVKIEISWFSLKVSTIYEESNTYILFIILIHFYSLYIHLSFLLDHSLVLHFDYFTL